MVYPVSTNEEKTTGSQPSNYSTNCKAYVAHKSVQRQKSENTTTGLSNGKAGNLSKGNDNYFQASTKK